MKYHAPKTVASFYYEGRKYPVSNGILEIPGKPVKSLQVLVEPKKKKD